MRICDYDAVVDEAELREEINVTSEFTIINGPPPCDDLVVIDYYEWKILEVSIFFIFKVNK
jgi:hypothetical protein